jgi:hypothetical protein
LWPGMDLCFLALASDTHSVDVEGLLLHIMRLSCCWVCVWVRGVALMGVGRPENGRWITRALKKGVFDSATPRRKSLLGREAVSGGAAGKFVQGMCGVTRERASELFVGGSLQPRRLLREDGLVRGPGSLDGAPLQGPRSLITGWLACALPRTRTPDEVDPSARRNMWDGKCEELEGVGGFRGAGWGATLC